LEGHEDRELEKLIEDMVRQIVSRPVAEEPEGGDDKQPVHIVLDDRELEKRVCSKPVAVVLFTSPRCPACHAYRPIFYSYAGRARRRHQGKVEFIEADVYHVYDKAVELGISATPTTVVFRRCRPVDGFVGIVDEETLAEMVEPHLASA